MKRQRETSIANARCEGRRKKRPACRRNMIKNTLRRPVASDNQAQTSRPAPLAIGVIPTIPAAANGGAPLISLAIGAACEMMLIPAVTLRNRMAQRAYHCQVERAALRVKSTVDPLAAFVLAGCQRPGNQP